MQHILIAVLRFFGPARHSIMYDGARVGRVRSFRLDFSHGREQDGPMHAESGGHGSCQLHKARSAVGMVRANYTGQGRRLVSLIDCRCTGTHQCRRYTGIHIIASINILLSYLFAKEESSCCPWQVRSPEQSRRQSRFHNNKLTRYIPPSRSSSAIVHPTQPAGPKPLQVSLAYLRAS